MTKLTRPAAQRLAEFVHLVGGEWNTPGILAALEQAAPTANAWDIAHALLNIAEDPTVKTPAFLTRPGAHWKRTDGSRVERRGDHNVPCPDHPTEHDMPCPNPPEPIDPTVQASLAAQARAGIAQGLERLHNRPLPGRVPPPGVTPKESHHVD